MKRYELSELAIWLDSSIRGASLDTDLGFRGISSDTRTVEPGNLFVALVGEFYDAHKFLADAARKGAAAFIVSDEAVVSSLPKDLRRPWILVQDTSAAFDRLGSWYRGKIKSPVIGVTGSVGKTSTREMIIAALATEFEVSGTKANLNNPIGLAHTLFETPEDTEVLVAELGIDEPGAMERLSRIASPDIAVITNIGVSHIAYFGSKEGIAQEKALIASDLGVDDWLLLNADEPLLLDLARSKAGQCRMAFVSTIGQIPADLPGPCLSAANIRLDAESSRFDCLETEPGQSAVVWLGNVRLEVSGHHHVQNALFGLLCAAVLGIPAEKAGKGLADFQITGNRQRVRRYGGLVVINDTYNASPESMKAGLETMSTMAEGRRKIAVFGGMNELGDLSETLHFQLGLDTARSGVDLVYLTGPEARHVELGVHSLAPDSEVFVFEDRDSLIRALLPRLEADDIVLVKGSRGFEMEKVCDAIEAFVPASQTIADDESAER